MRCLLLIPAFNEEPTIGPLIQAAKTWLPEILVVDDGSADRTGVVAAAAGAVVHRLPENRGKGVALKTGFEYALAHHYDRVITLDGDGQHDPQDIAAFLPLLEHYDLILGNRMEARETVPPLRRVANRTSSFIVSALCAQRIHDSQTGFRSYSARLLESVQLDCSYYDLESEVIIKAARAGLRIGHCRIRTIYADEVSRFRNLKDSLRFLQVVVRAFFGTWNEAEPSVSAEDRPAGAHGRWHVRTR